MLHWHYKHPRLRCVDLCFIGAINVTCVLLLQRVERVASVTTNLLIRISTCGLSFEFTQCLLWLHSNDYPIKDDAYSFGIPSTQPEKNYIQTIFPSTKCLKAWLQAHLMTGWHSNCVWFPCRYWQSILTFQSTWGIYFLPFDWRVTCKGTTIDLPYSAKVEKGRHFH